MTILGLCTVCGMQAQDKAEGDLNKDGVSDLWKS